MSKNIKLRKINDLGMKELYFSKKQNLLLLS